MKYCLISGASRGLGEVLARGFWEAGYSLVLVARDALALTKVCTDLGSRSGRSVVPLVHDLSEPNEVEELARNVKQSVPRLDVLINNAAIQGPIGPLWQNDMAFWRKTMQVDLFAPVEICRAFVPWMSESGGGSIINLSGGGATGPRANFSAYATAKAGLVRFSETLAQETESLGIRVNCIAPGAMKTGMMEEVLSRGAHAAGLKEYGIASKLMNGGEGASMDRVAELCLFLASDKAAGISGKLISAVWDSWQDLSSHMDDLKGSDIYTLRRITPKDRGLTWDQ